MVRYRPSNYLLPIAKRARYATGMSPRFRTALAVGRYVYRNRRAFKPAARMIQRTYRAYKKKGYRSRLEKGVKSTSKVSSDGSTFSTSAVTMGTLTANFLPGPIQGTSGETVRDRMTINVKGYKICRWFEYIPSETDVGPIEIHWALLQWKDSLAVDTAILLNDFFRDNSSNLRTRDFNTYVANSPWDIGKNCMPINPDQKVNVLMHKRKRIVPVGIGLNQVHNSMWKIDKYIKIGKHVRFDATSSTNFENAIFEVFWYNTVSPTGFPLAPTAVNYVNTWRMNQCYWREPK